MDAYAYREGKREKEREKENRCARARDRCVAILQPTSNSIIAHGVYSMPPSLTRTCLEKSMANDGFFPLPPSLPIPFHSTPSYPRARHDRDAVSGPFSKRSKGESRGNRGRRRGRAVMAPPFPSLPSPLNSTHPRRERRSAGRCSAGL